jgi:hypothetical protein
VEHSARGISFTKEDEEEEQEQNLKKQSRRITE